MREPFTTQAEPLALVAQACRCADSILTDYLGVPVTKAERLNTPAAFDHAVGRLAAALRDSATGFEQKAMRAALATLDVDWLKTTAAERRQLIDQAMAAARPNMKAGCDAAAAQLPGAAREVVGAARADARQHGLNVGRDFTAFDQRVMAFMTRSQTLFVRDEYAARAEAFGTQAREIVARRMADGLGRDDIAEELEVAAQGNLLRRPKSYWEVVAGAFVGRGRSCAQVGAYEEAGITHYQVEAVLDERTSNVCRLLHGKVFSVRDAQRSFRETEQLKNPADIKEVNPWPREDAGGIYVSRGGRRVTVAEVSRSAVGTRDDRGDFAAERPASDLARLGLGFPPYHGLCRSTTLPILQH